MFRSFALILALASASFGQAPAQTPAPAEPPRRSLELAIRLVNGQQLLLSQYRGKVVALEFLHTTCPHCQYSSQVLSKLQAELGPRGFQALGLAMNKDAEPLLPDFLQQFHVNFPVGIGKAEDMLTYLVTPPKSYMLPQLVFIDKRGFIRAHLCGNDPFFQNTEANMRSMIETLLKEPARAKPVKAHAR